MADITNQNEATVSNNNVRSEMPRIWRISHSHINDVDHQKLIENNMLAIGFLENMERGVTTIRDRFSNIGNGDYFYLVRRGYIVLFGQFGETNQTGIINEDMIAFNGQKLDFSKQLNGWLYRQINKLNASSTPFANNNIKCDPKDKILK